MFSIIVLELMTLLGRQARVLFADKPLVRCAERRRCLQGAVRRVYSVAIVGGGVKRLWCYGKGQAAGGSRSGVQLAVF